MNQTLNRFPIIVLEGLDGVGKTTLAARLSHALGASLLRTPPSLCVPGTPLEPDVRGHFDARPPAVRRAYYRFANLLVSELAQLEAASRPVVIDRYWPSTVAFALGMEGPESPLHAWQGRYPPELCVPDVTILLTADQAARDARISHRGAGFTTEERRLAQETIRRAILDAYAQFEPVVIDTSGLTPDGVFDRALATVRDASRDV